MVNANQITQIFVSEARRHLMLEYLPWLRACLEQLSEADLWWRPNEKSNSAGNLILHLCGNVRQWIVHGIGGAADVRNRDAEFAEKGPIPKAELIAMLETTLQQADAVLQRVKADDLPSHRFIQEYDQTVLSTIFHVVEHFSYHTGQIIYLTKTRTERDMKFWNL